MQSSWAIYHIERETSTCIQEGGFVILIKLQTLMKLRHYLLSVHDVGYELDPFRMAPKVLS